MNKNDPMAFDPGAFHPREVEPRNGLSQTPQRRLRWRWRATGIVVALIVAGGAFGAVAPLLSAAPGVKYHLAAIETGPIVSVITAAGTLKPLAAILVGSQASGQIKHLPADFNSVVKAGDVIARLDDETVRARLAQANVEVEVATAAADVQRAQLQRAQTEASGAQANLTVAHADLERAEATFNDAERERERKHDLFARGVGSVAERDRSDVAYATARTQLAAAKARVSGAIASQAGADAVIGIARAQLENALAQIKQRETILQQVRIDLEHTMIRAPIDGVVINRTVDVGQTVAASLQTPTLFTIAPDLRAMEVHADVDEAEIGRVLPGQDVSFTVDTYPGHAFPGRVADIRKMPQTIQNVVTYTVVISAGNEDLLLLPGMTANVRILLQQRDNAMRLPNAALRFRPLGISATNEQAHDRRAVFPPGRGQANTANVWVVGPFGRPEPKSLQLGITDGLVTEILAGDLHSGDRIIVGATAQPRSSVLAGF